jgi:predicted O-linked N-acetylglucosamine transferase (SPINDLY family)
MAAGNLAEAGTLALALAGLGELALIDLVGVAGLLAGQGKTEQTVALYRLWLKHSDAPLAYVAWYNLAVLLQTDDVAGAEHAYRRSLALHAGFTESQLGLGVLLERQRQPQAALQLWRDGLDQLDATATATVPMQLRLLNNIGRLAAAGGDLAQAEDALLRSLQLDPRQPLVVPQWLSLRQQLCAWPVAGFVPGLSETALNHAASALAMLGMNDDPARQLTAAQRDTRRDLPPAAALTALAAPEGYSHRRLRIGYLSCGLGAHPTGRLAAELFELHNRDQVEVYGFCWSEEDSSALRQRLLRGLDLHVPIGPLTDVQAAQAIRAHEIDILVDLHGRLPGGRPAILQHRPAPVQIAWLGQPGPSGMAAVDYLLADPVVLPPELAPYYTEAPLYLPHCFQPQDRQRPLPPVLDDDQRREGREACGLPPDSFVFCCFGAAAHITPARWATWMEILRQTPDSVLWLAAASEPVRDNLRVAALRHGVGSERLCFAEAGTGAAPATGLARYPLADLFLDTGPYSSGAGAEAGEALWAGLPLLTCPGRSFASRAGASLLQAAGLPELIARNEQRYAALAVRMAARPKELARLRNRLRKHRASAPLFDTAALVQDLERLYLRVARGTLKTGRKRTAAAAANGTGPAPLVSILIPAADPALLAGTLSSALAQSYAQCEIIISDSSADGACLAPLKPYLKAHRRLRYTHAPGLAPLDNLNHCLAMALGEYVAAAPAGETLAPEKIAVMLPYFLQHPRVSMVACWRQPHTADGQALPGAPVFATELVVSGASLASLLLGGDGGTAAAMCAPGALLLRRATLEGAYGMYQKSVYRDRASVATALTALATGDYVYLPQPLAHYRATAVAPATPLVLLDTAMENLQLLYQAHAQGHSLGDPGRFRQLLSARMAELNTIVAAHHVALAAEAGRRIDTLQRVMRIGYQLLLAPE